MPPLLVLFDVDGTLVDCAGAGRRAIVEAFREVYGIDGVAAAAERVRFEGKTDPVIVSEIARHAGISPERVARTRGRFREAFLAALRKEMSRPDPRRRVMPGVLPLLSALEGRPGITMGLLTGNVEEGARAKLEPFGLNRFFAGGGFSSDHPDRTEIARKARERMAAVSGVPFPPAAVVVVGDTENDIACARANGYRAVAVVSGWVPRERLEAARPDHLFDDFTDLAAVLAALGVGG